MTFLHVHRVSEEPWKKSCVLLTGKMSCGKQNFHSRLSSGNSPGDVMMRKEILFACSRISVFCAGGGCHCAHHFAMMATHARTKSIKIGKKGRKRKRPKKAFFPPARSQRGNTCETRCALAINTRPLLRPGHPFRFGRHIDRP